VRTVVVWALAFVVEALAFGVEALTGRR